MRLLIRWEVDQPEATASLIRDGRELARGALRLAAWHRLALALAETAPLSEELQHGLILSVLSTPELAALAGPLPAPWRGVLELRCAAGDAAPRRLCDLRVTWTGRAWRLRGLLREGPLLGPRRWALRTWDGWSRPARDAISVAAVLIVTSSASFWGHAERVGAVVALVYDPAPRSALTPRLGALRVPAAPAGALNDRAALADALDACLQAGARHALVLAPLDLWGPGEEALAESLDRWSDRLTWGIAHGLRGVRLMPARGAHAILQTPPSEARGVGPGLAISLYGVAADRTAERAEVLPTAATALADAVLSADRAAGRPLVSVDSYQGRDDLPWVPYAISARLAAGDERELVVTRWGDEDWARACGGALDAVIVGFSDGEGDSAAREWPSRGVAGAVAGRVEAPLDVRVAGLTQELVARARGAPPSLRLWDLEVARWLAPPARAPVGDGAPRGLELRVVPTTLGAALLSNALLFAPWIALLRLIRRRPGAALWGALLALAQLPLGFGLLRALGIYLPVIACGLVILGVSLWHMARAGLED